MKKLQKLTLKELENSAMVISHFESNSLNGGVSEQDYNAAVAAGTWTGGQVDGMGYVSQDVNVTAPELVEIGNTGIYIPLSCVNTNPPVDQGSIPNTPTPSQIYDDHWRSASGATGSDESAQRVDTPLLELLWKKLFGN